mgnify:CR=1 FL=1
MTIGQERSVTQHEPATVIPPHGEAAEAAIIQQMREDGQLPQWPIPASDPSSDPLPRWKIETEKPVAPQGYRRFRLRLDGGLELAIDDQFKTVIVEARFTTVHFPFGAQLEACAARLPGLVLPVLRAAVADLERMVAAQHE